jgi:potassium-dependent mechanosensitive channel
MVFTVGIGENAATGAELVAACRWLGVEFDAARNAERRGLISRDDAAVKVVVVPTDEERKTARHTVEMLDVIGKGTAGMRRAFALDGEVLNVSLLVSTVARLQSPADELSGDAPPTHRLPNPCRAMAGRSPAVVVNRMRVLLRLACLGSVLGLLLAGNLALAQTVPQPQRPVGQLVELWTHQLDRIATRADQPDLLPAEIDSMREQVIDVRTAASAAAALARSDLADTRKLLAPLATKPGTDAVPETEAVKAERERLSAQAAESESAVKQCELVIARADQLLERMTKLRGAVVLQTLLRRDASPLSPEVWSKLVPQFTSAVQTLSTATVAWAREGLGGLQFEPQDYVALAAWAAATVVAWWLGGALRRRYGRGEATEPGQRDRTIAAAIDGVGLVLVPILAVWLIGKVLTATSPPPPIDQLVPAFIIRVIDFLLVVGLTAAALSPTRPNWRVLPFTDDSAHALSHALRRLMGVGVSVDFVYVALTRGGENREALSAVGALVLATIIAFLTLPALATRAWYAARSDEPERPTVIGGTWWSITRLALSMLVLSAIALAMLGYATLAAHLHNAIYTSCLLIAVALLLHRLVRDLLEAAAAPNTPPGRWARRRFGLAPDATLRGHQLVILFFDLILVAVLAIGIPAAWGADTEAILVASGQLWHGVKVGGVTISLGNIGIAIIAFGIVLALFRLLRSVMRNRVLPTVDAPLPLRQSIDAALNYVGVAIAIMTAITALGIDFTNLAIVLGALSVGIGLGLQNIANNVISGVFLLLERPIKAGDWVNVAGFEGFVRRIDIRATEIETFQRTSVIIPNSIFLQNPVVNRTYFDASSRVELKFTVGLNTDVSVMEGLLREAALGHRHVLRVPAPIVRFLCIIPTGLEFELFVFVARVEDRLVVNNELNRAILAKLIELKIIDPRPVPELRVRGIDEILQPAKAGSDGHAGPKA